MYFYDTLTAQKLHFKSQVPGVVNMYCCGVTPYSNTHIGHTRTFFAYDLLYRALCDQGYTVRWARNVTDVDDKIIRKAQDENCSCADIVTRYVNEQNQALAVFSLHKPQHEPWVTEHMEQIRIFIARLMEQNLAYATPSGVYYRVKSFSEYGKLSKNRTEDLRRGVRIEVDDDKEDPLDFALWKFAKPGEIFWPSPWGEGRPGWHIECSAMIQSLFGEDGLDIHMGGRDLIFPHHECEIAQSEGLTHKPLARYWLHTGMVTLYGEKMSKSTNHYVGIEDFLKKYPPEVLRLVFLSSAYAQPLDFTYELVNENFLKLQKLYGFYQRAEDLFAKIENNELNISESAPIAFELLGKIQERLKERLADDLDSPGLLGILFQFIHEFNKNLKGLLAKNEIHIQDAHTVKKHWPTLKKWLQTTLGLWGTTPEEFQRSLFEKVGIGKAEVLSWEDFEAKKQIYFEARENKNWEVVQSLREEWAALGLAPEDGKTETKWTVTRL